MRASRIRKSAPSVAPEFKLVAAQPGTVSDDTRSGRMSPRGRNKFLFAGFGRISVTRLLSVRSKTEKKTGIFCTKQPLCAVFYGGFLLFEASGPEILPPGRKNPSPEKEIPGPEKKIPSPEIFFPGPVFFRRRLGSTFSRYLELFHRQIPGVNMSAQAPPGLRAPVIPARKQPHPRQKESLRPPFADILVSAHSAKLRFLRPPPPPAPYK